MNKQDARKRLISFTLIRLEAKFSESQSLWNEYDLMDLEACFEMSVVGNKFYRRFVKWVFEISHSIKLTDYHSMEEAQKLCDLQEKISDFVYKNW